MFIYKTKKIEDIDKYISEVSLANGPMLKYLDSDEASTYFSSEVHMQPPRTIQPRLLLIGTSRPAATVFSSKYTTEDYAPGVETQLNAKAKEYGYDNIVSACSYANSTVEKFRREGTAFCKWRDLCWEYVFNITDPNISPEEVITNLPEFEPVLAQQ